MRFTNWRKLFTVENEFYNSLNYIVKLMNRIANSSGDDQQKYVDMMNNFQNSKHFNNYIDSSVARMVISLSKSNERTWREASKKMMQGKFLNKALREEIEKSLNVSIQNQIKENASLIKTLPSDVSQKVVKDIYDQAIKGRRSSSIAEMIRGMTDKHARASARLIARTETSKTTTALTKARCEGLNLKWYVWRTALDGDRVRKSHRNMEGVLVNWDNPPSPEALVGEKSVGNYHAGNIWNCRCYPEPLIDVDDVKWDHKVYLNGSIQMMSKRKFEDLL